MKFKPGDEIIFLRDVRDGNESFIQDPGKLKIPKNKTCTLVKMNNSHIWVQYEGKTHMLRNIENRIAPAGKASVLLYGEKE